MKEFQDLVSQVHVEEAHLIDIFFNSLKTEMKEVIKMKEPKSLPDHIAAIIMMKDSDICKLFTNQKSQEAKGGKQLVHSQFKSLQSSRNHSWKSKQHSADSGAKVWDKPGVNKQTEKQTGQVKCPMLIMSIRRRMDCVLSVKRNG